MMAYSSPALILIATIVVFLGDARVAMIEKRAGEVRMVATVDGGC